MYNDGRTDSFSIIKAKLNELDELLEAIEMSDRKKVEDILQEIRDHIDNLEGTIAVMGR